VRHPGRRTRRPVDSPPMDRLIQLYLRAGGGHNFSGGSHSSSSHSSGSSGFHSTGTSSGGGGAGIFILLILVLIVIVVVVMLRRKSKKVGSGAGTGAGTGYAPPTPPAAPYAAPGSQAGYQAGGAPWPPQGGAGTPPPPPPPPPTEGSPFTPPVAPAAPADPISAGLQQIREHDPGFEDDKFITDAQRSFFMVQQAWTELKPDMSRRVMADNIWQQHKVQIEGYESQNKRNVLEGLAIANASIIKAESDGAYDTIVLRMLAGCADYDIDMKSNKVVRGNKSFSQFTEDWTFQRSSKATTKAGGGTMQQRCPNCGAPLDLDLQGVCKYCHAAVMSGDYDWVLTRIEQVM
jgi:predicted lipid-binding transport protein (Tim44 family)